MDNSAPQLIQLNQNQYQIQQEEVTMNTNKHRLWKQVPTKNTHSNLKSKYTMPDTNTEPTSTQLTVAQNTLYKHRKNSQSTSQIIDQQMYKSALRPSHRKKQKCSTISNFLQELQIQSKDTKDNNSKYQNDSEILSILDIKYNESFYSDNNTNQSFIKRNSNPCSRSCIKLLLCAARNSVKPLKQQITNFINSLLQMLSTINQSYLKLVAKYQSQLAQKNLQIRHLQLKSRQIKLNNSQTTHRVQSKLFFLQSQNKFLQNKNKDLVTSLNQFELRYKQSHQQNLNIKKYNIQLNQMLLKYHKKIEDLEIKIKQNKKQYQILLNDQIQKLNTKHQLQLKQQQQHYQLKLQNKKIKLLINNINLKNNNILPSPTTLSLPPSRISPSQSQIQCHNTSTLSISRIQDKTTNSCIEECITNINSNKLKKQPTTDQPSTKKNNNTDKYLDCYTSHCTNNQTNNTTIMSKQQMQQSITFNTVHDVHDSTCNNDNKINVIYTSQHNNLDNTGNNKLNITNSNSKRALTSTRTPHININNNHDDSKNSKGTTKDNNDRHHYSPKSTSSKRFQRTVKFVSATNILPPSLCTSSSANIHQTSKSPVYNRLHKSNNISSNPKINISQSQLQQYTSPNQQQQLTNPISKQNFLFKRDCPPAFFSNQSSSPFPPHNNVYVNKNNNNNNLNTSPININNNNGGNVVSWKSNKNNAVVDKRLRQTIN